MRTLQPPEGTAERACSRVMSVGAKQSISGSVLEHYVLNRPYPSDDLLFQWAFRPVVAYLRPKGHTLLGTRPSLL